MVPKGCQTYTSLRVSLAPKLEGAGRNFVSFFGGEGEVTGYCCFFRWLDLVLQGSFRFFGGVGLCNNPMYYHPFIHSKKKKTQADFLDH